MGGLGWDKQGLTLQFFSTHMENTTQFFLIFPGQVRWTVNEMNLLNFHEIVIQCSGMMVLKQK